MQVRYEFNQSNFNKIPGYNISYWVSNIAINNFDLNHSLEEICIPKCGLKTGITEKYVLPWQEVNFLNIGFDCKTRIDSIKSKKKWFPVSDGQEYRKWYGNNYDVVNWYNDGYEIRHLYSETGKLKSRPQNMDFYFKKGITWSALTSKNLSLRLNPPGNIIEGAGYGCFNDTLNLNPVMALLNSIVASYFSKCLSGTLNFEVGVLARIPVNNNIFNQKVEMLSQDCVGIAKTDWDSFETSWDFKKHPLI